MDEVNGRSLVACHKFHCQTLQAVGNGQIHDLQGSSELGELRGPQKNNLQADALQ